MATTTTTTNKPLNPRAQDLSPKGYNRANIFSGKALDFDGVNDTISIPNSTSLNITGNALTIFGHVNHDGSGAWQSIAYKDTGNNVGYQLFINTSSVFAFGIHTSTSFLRLETSEIISAGRWYTFACTYDGAMMSIYVNGRLSIQTAKTGDITDSSAAPFYVGRNFAGSEVLNARLAGLRVFNTALTPAQVSDLYLNPEKIVPDGVASSALKLWLPMMEGAGASAYDGSGNGNDGTINGATWTAGIGAPVAQTALVSWDKGSNLLTNSEQFTSVWAIDNGVATANTATAPNGTTTADTIANNATNGAHRFYQLGTAFTSTGLLSFSIRLKYKDHRHVSFGLTDDSIYRAQVVVDLQNGTITQNYVEGGTAFVSSSIEDIGGGWYEIKATINATSAWNGNLYALGLLLNGSTFSSAGYVGTGTGVYVWGATANFGAESPYIKTNATAQTSAVLVPEGLTAGASIFGTNIITPRNAFALNLDGASWAEVHDNASLDITSAITLEAWVYWDDSENSKGILGKWDPIANQCYLIYEASSSRAQFYISSTGVNAQNVEFTIPSNGWVHIVGTDDGTNQKLYINGAEEATTASFGSIFQSDLPLEIGRYDANAVRNYHNSIANPRIYNRALTAAEVLRNYNADRPKFGL